MPNRRHATDAAPARPRALYRAPRVVRIAVETSRTHMHHQYAGDITCTRHNHDDPGVGTNGCTFPA